MGPRILQHLAVHPMKRFYTSQVIARFFGHSSSRSSKPLSDGQFAVDCCDFGIRLSLIGEVELVVARFERMNKSRRLAGFPKTWFWMGRKCHMKQNIKNQFRSLKRSDLFFCSPLLKFQSVSCISIWVFPKIGVPQNGWFTMGNPIKRDDLGVPPF